MNPQQEAGQRFQAALEEHRLGHLEQAERLYREAIELAPAHGVAHNNLGLILAARGNIEAACGHFQHTLDLDPQATDAARNLAQAHHHCGRLRQALDCCRQLLRIDPQPSGARLRIVDLHALLGETGAARTALLEAAAAIAPGDPCFEPLIAQLETFSDQAIAAGDIDAGWQLAGALCRLQPNHLPGLRMLAHCLRRAHPRLDDAQLDADLRLCLASRELDHQGLARPCLALLRARYPALDCAEPRVFLQPAVSRDPLLLAWLGRCLNTDPAMERQLQRLRRLLLLRLDAAAGIDPAQAPLLAALALQCFANEYLYPQSADENARLETLTSDLMEHRGGWRKLGSGDYPKLLVLACYRPWYRLPRAGELANRLADQAPAWLHEARRRILNEPLAEQHIAARLQAGKVHDPISRAVRRQYEQSPYPRWHSLEPEPADSVGDYLRHLFPHFRPSDPLNAAVRILIAGCGTGEHAIRVALRHPRAQVTAIDLSLASLAYAQRQADRLAVANLSLRQADILALPDFGAPFQVIESVGVLHHLARPAAGLAALIAVLDKQGVMKLGLYSRTARRHVNLARQRITALGLGNQAADIRFLRNRILDGLEPDLKPLLRSLDFYSLSNCRDLLFHVQEHQYDIPALQALLDEQRLDIIGFQFSGNAAAQHYLDLFPAEQLPGPLRNWHTVEQRYPDTFAGMYQFWCQRR